MMISDPVMNAASLRNGCLTLGEMMIHTAPISPLMMISHGQMMGAEGNDMNEIEKKIAEIQEYYLTPEMRTRDVDSRDVIEKLDWAVNTIKSLQAEKEELHKALRDEYIGTVGTSETLICLCSTPWNRGSNADYLSLTDSWWKPGEPEKHFHEQDGNPCLAAPMEQKEEE